MRPATVGEMATTLEVAFGREPEQHPEVFAKALELYSPELIAALKDHLTKANVEETK